MHVHIQTETATGTYENQIIENAIDGKKKLFCDSV